MSAQSLKERIRTELPGLLREDPSLRGFLRGLLAEEFADRQRTEDRFDRALAELARDREESARRWDEQRKEDAAKWRENAEQWKKWLEQDAAQWKKWLEQDAAQWKEWREQDTAQWKEWREQDAAKWQEQRRYDEKKQEEDNERFRRTHEEIMAISDKLERKIGALGARWGMKSEASFRNALAGILEEHFGVQVLNVNEYDEAGEVFGRPDQVEIDVIIKNGLLILAELKSSIDKAGIYIFERKARFYERRHGRKADRLIVISPMIDKKAQQVADRLGIRTYSDSSEVEEL